MITAVAWWQWTGSLLVTCCYLGPRPTTTTGTRHWNLWVNVVGLNTMFRSVSILFALAASVSAASTLNIVAREVQITGVRDGGVDTCKSQCNQSYPSHGHDYRADWERKVRMAGHWVREQDDKRSHDGLLAE